MPLGTFILVFFTYEKIRFLIIFLSISYLSTYQFIHPSSFIHSVMSWINFHWNMTEKNMSGIEAIWGVQWPHINEGLIRRHVIQSSLGLAVTVALFQRMTAVVFFFMFPPRFRVLNATHYWLIITPFISQVKKMDIKKKKCWLTTWFFFLHSIECVLCVYFFLVLPRWPGCSEGDRCEQLCCRSSGHLMTRQFTGIHSRTRL